MLNSDEIVLQEAVRACGPYKGMWNLPGGFVDRGKTTAALFRRLRKSKPEPFSRLVVPLGRLAGMSGTPAGKRVEARQSFPLFFLQLLASGGPTAAMPLFSF